VSIHERHAALRTSCPFCDQDRYDPAVKAVSGVGDLIDPGPVGGPWTLRLRGRDTNGAMSVFQNVIAPGRGTPLHVHWEADEAFFVVSGVVDFVIGEERLAQPSGSLLFAPRGVPHCFANLGQTAATLLVVFTPASMEDMFERFQALASHGEHPTLETFAGRFDIDVVGPSLVADR
jgi:mannose-6-phosphate isomerase-like protein (cupin superfamily)